jgi:hypothetical protein
MDCGGPGYAIVTIANSPPHSKVDGEISSCQYSGLDTPNLRLPRLVLNKNQIAWWIFALKLLRKYEQKIHRYDPPKATNRQ